MFLIYSTKSFSKGISYFTCLGLYSDFIPYHSVLSSMLLSVLSLLLKCIAFHLIFVITIPTFSINCNKYVLSEGIGCSFGRYRDVLAEGIGMFLIEYPKFTFSIMKLKNSKIMLNLMEQVSTSANKRLH